MTSDVERVVAAAFREDWSWLVAMLIRLTNDWDLAEDCAQEAFAQALSSWRADGPPERRRAWLATTARNRAVDHIRRERVGSNKLRMLVVTEGQEDEVDYDKITTGIPDDRLRLIYTCCHPSLGLEAQVCLSLRTLCGLTTAEIARTFFVSESTMARRISRTKEKIAAAGIAYQVPPARALPARTNAVLAVIYLLFNEGYAAASGPDLIRYDLCGNAVKFSRMVADLMHDNPESIGLYALLLLLHARSPARIDAHGVLVPLEDQDRSAWDAAMVEEGVAAVKRALEFERVGPYQLQALIAACHATAPTAAETDWMQIVALYDDLYALTPTPTVWLNRAVAVGMRDGYQAGLDSLDKLATPRRQDEHPLVPAVRADLLRRLGRLREAAEQYRQALTQTQNEGERAYLLRRQQACEEA
ncbi:sigma-70 family RNA polymerase sigma factor [Asanoa sp. NPDC049573]|uniref:RNA polymerase sigma factor n=1 Tax=Asanoa sp. NPDC049573 TaxID=3155396 RepID=UPI0034437AAE